MSYTGQVQFMFAQLLAKEKLCLVVFCQGKPQQRNRSGQNKINKQTKSKTKINNPPQKKKTTIFIVVIFAVLSQLRTIMELCVRNWIAKCTLHNKQLICSYICAKREPTLLKYFYSSSKRYDLPSVFKPS